MGSLAMTTLARVKQLIAPIQSTDHDALITEMIASVSAEVESFLSRWALVDQRYEYHSVQDVFSRRFWLRGYPIVSIDEVKNDPDWDWDAASAIDAENYTSDGSERSGKLLFSTSLALLPGQNALRVQYTGGMAADTAAFVAAFQDLAGAVDQQVAYEFQRRLEMGATASSVGGHNVAYQPAIKLLPVVEQKIRHHRNLARAI